MRMRIHLAMIACGFAWLTTSGAGTPPPVSSHRGVEVGFTGEGDPYLGVENAPVTLEEWSDYACPFCARHYTRTFPALLDQYIRPGKLKIVFRDLPLEGLHETAPKAHAAARCVGQQGATAYWAMHDTLFERQAEWSRLPDPAAFLAETVRGLGLDVTAYEACMKSPEASAKVAASVKAGEAQGFNGTPQFRFLSAGRDPYPMSGAQPQARFDSIIAALLTGAALPAAEEPQEPAAPAELPLWARREGLAPDPKRPGRTVSGDAFKGNPHAPVVVVEFSDFQCESCARHAIEVQPRIDATFVDTGQVLWVSKHLPLKKHPYAAVAAVAAECAGDQGRYFEMSQRLYATVATWAQPDAESTLPALARELKLDPVAFERCFNGRPALERVMQDMADAQGIVQRTPSFVILSGGTTGSIAAPMPADQFIAFLRNQVDGASKPAIPK